MKVLVVSFDKTLVEDLKKAFSDHELHVAKNTEEAIKMMPSDIEGVIYDAISGAISEEDINTLYTKKFSNARYIILYDELFPVDEGNIIVPQKLLVPRDENPQEIVRKLEEFPLEPVLEVEEPPQQPSTEFEIEPTHFEEEKEIKDVPTDIEEVIKEIESSTEEPPQTQIEAQKQTEKTEEPKKTLEKILIVSFDQTLVDSVASAFGADYEIRNVKTVKQAMEEGKDADLIVFDAISGVIAEKGLIEMSADPKLSEKAYLILIDDLFPINVDSIPLTYKEALSRDTDPQRIKEVAEELFSKAQPTDEITEQSEEIPSLESFPIEDQQVTQQIEESPQEEISTELPKEEEEEIPALSALERVIEEQQLKSEPSKAEEEINTKADMQVEIDKLLEDTLKKSLSDERLKQIFTEVLEGKISQVREIAEDIIRNEIRNILESINVEEIIRQITYQVLKERLEELIS